ncbi:MAG: hypothetical protein EBZ77_15945 [Chitinophagia bacterium]|nr:hypothetical protein [Chitinophagia bacterium]
MKYLLSILAASVMLYSCTKTETKTAKQPVEISATDAFDSMNLQYRTFYRMAISVAHGTADSNSAVKFFANDSGRDYQ